MTAEFGDPREPVDEDAIYRELGRYIVIFQSLHGLLFQICWLLSDPPNSEEARSELAKFERFSKLRGEAGRRVYTFLLDEGRGESRFAQDFCALLCRCRELGNDRNRIVHSAYIHLESFGELHGIVRSDMRKGRSEDGGVSLDQKDVTPESIKKHSKKIADTYMALSMSHKQLIAWRSSGQ